MEEHPSHDHFKDKKEKARLLFEQQRVIHNPYFGRDIVLNADGFHHLQFSARRERSKEEQKLKFSLLPLAFDVVRKSGTIQEYRKTLIPVGKRHSGDGSVKMKTVEYWGLVAIVGSRPIRIRTILRRIGDGNITFWSVMPHSKIKNSRQKLASEGIDEE